MERLGWLSCILGMLCLPVLLSFSALATPTTLMYQGRIVKSDGQALEAPSVSFIFQITNPTGSCVIYQERVSGISMVNSGGVFDVPIGTGSVNYPTSGGFSVIDTFDNDRLFSCGDCVGYSCSTGTGTYQPVVTDGRLLRVQFFDGSGWKTVRPDNAISAVPYAGYAASAKKFAGKETSDFVLKNDLPAVLCTSTQVLTYSSLGLVCVEDAGGATGTVSSIIGAGPITATGTGAVTISANIGQGANTLAAGDDSRFTDARVPTGGASGDLTGNYPGPTIAANAVTTAKIVNGAVTSAKIADGTIEVTDFSNVGVSAGEVFRFSGGLWTHSKLNYTDLVNSTGASPWPAGACGVNQVITWVSVSDGFGCTTLSSGVITAALGYTPVSNARNVNTGVSTTTGLTGGGSLTADLNLAVNVGVGANQIPQLDASGKLLSSVLPSVVSDALWGASGGNVFRNSGNVGVGTSTPATLLHIHGVGEAGGVSDAGAKGATLRINASNAAVGTGGVVEFASSSDTFAAIKGHATDTSNNGYGALTFLTRNATTDIALTERMRIQGSGFVGINTNIPATMLHVARDSTSAATNPFGDWQGNGQVMITGSTASTKRLAIGVDTTTPAMVSIIQSIEAAITTRPLALNPAGGNVGIGTLSPAYRLDIQGADTSADGLSLNVKNTSSSANAWSGIRLANDTATTGFLWMGSSGYADTHFRSRTILQANSSGVDLVSNNGDLRMYSGGKSASDERVRLTSTGNLGINTISPSSKLEVSGTSTLGLLRLNGGDIVPGTGNFTQIAFGYNGTSDYSHFIRTRHNSGSASNNAIDFYTSDSTPAGVFPTNAVLGMTINNGMVGIGTLAPAGNLHVIGPDNTGTTAGLIIDSGAQRMLIDGNEIDSNTDLYLNNNFATRVLIGMGGGNVGVGTTNPTQKLHIVGNLRVQGATDCTLGNGSGGTNCSSDIRLKDNVQEISASLDKILTLRGVEFDWNEKSLSSGRHDIGVIAQDVEKVFPTAVIEEPQTGYKKVDYAVLVAPLIQALKELNKKVTDLFSTSNVQSRDIASLKSENSQIRIANETLRKSLEKLEKENAEMQKRLLRLEEKLESH